MSTRRAFTHLSWVFVVLIAFVTCGCLSTGYSSKSVNGHESVYRNDEDGTKTLVYEVAKDGTVTIHDESDPRAQQVMKYQAKAEESKAADEARIDKIKQAPKRDANDPIRVALYDIELDPKLAESQHTEGAVYEQLRKEFETDKVIRLVNARDLQGAEYAQISKLLTGKSTTAAPPADVEVVSKSYIKEVAGINKQTGKLGKMTAIVFEARITCNYLPAEYTVEEQGNVFRNVEVTKKFADKIKQVIKVDIGPTLPADRSL